MKQQKQNRSPLFHIGNAFIILSLFGLLYTIFPLAQLSFFPKREVLPPNTKTSIEIPKIHALSPIIQNVDPWNEVVYKQALRKGVAQAANASTPEKTGTVYLFAHSSGMPWEQTRFNTVFLKLGELQSGDLIILSWYGKTYRYRVFDKEVVAPQETDFLTKQQNNILILQTCTPIGTDWKRLLILAKRD